MEGKIIPYQPNFWEQKYENAYFALQDLEKDFFKKIASRLEKSSERQNRQILLFFLTDNEYPSWYKEEENFTLLSRTIAWIKDGCKNKDVLLELAHDASHNDFFEKNGIKYFIPKDVFGPQYNKRQLIRYILATFFDLPYKKLPVGSIISYLFSPKFKKAKDDHDNILVERFYNAKTTQEEKTKIYQERYNILNERKPYIEEMQRYIEEKLNLILNQTDTSPFSIDL